MARVQLSLLSYCFQIAFLVGLAAVLGCTGSPMRESEPNWEAEFGREHPLVGRIYELRSDAFISEAELATQLAQQRFVLLGEKHDNPDQHTLQARLIQQLAEQRGDWTLALEMLPADLAAELKAATADDEPEAEDVRDAVDWDELGWPDFDSYAPVFESALDASLPLYAADLGRPELRTLRDHGLTGLSMGRRAELELDHALPESSAVVLRDGILDGHCGHVRGEMLDRMVEVQRARDAQLAQSLHIAAGSAGRAILLAGAEHVRNDHGVPWYLRQKELGAAMASLAFVEVGEAEAVGQALAERYGGRPPFDYVWFTPRVDDQDPCEKFRDKLEAIHKK